MKISKTTAILVFVFGLVLTACDVLQDQVIAQQKSLIRDIFIHEFELQEQLKACQGEAKI